MAKKHHKKKGGSLHVHNMHHKPKGKDKHAHSSHHELNAAHDMGEGFGHDHSEGQGEEYGGEGMADNCSYS